MIDIPSPQLNVPKVPSWVEGRHPETPRPLLKSLSFNLTENEPKYEDRGSGDNQYRVLLTEIQDKSGKMYTVALFKSQLDECIRLAQEGKRFGIETSHDKAKDKDLTIIIEAP